MNWLGSGFIIIINYVSSNGSGGLDDGILTEASNNILAENSLYLQTETA